MSETGYQPPPQAERSATAPVMRLRDLLGALRDDAAAAYDAKQSGQPRGPITRIPQLDDVLGGALQPGVHVLHASPGAGKTALAIRGDARSVLVVVDSLHSWSSAAFAEGDEYARLAVGLADLLGVAQQLGAPVLVIAERNRASMAKGGMSAGAGHRGIEFGAESVWSLNREENDRLGPLGDVTVTLKIEKN